MDKQLLDKALKVGFTEDGAKWYFAELAQNMAKRLHLVAVKAEAEAAEIFADELTEKELTGKNANIDKALKRGLSVAVKTFINALNKAKKAADKVADIEDGGTCNFDTPQVEVTNLTAAQVKTACAVAEVLYVDKGRPISINAKCCYHIAYTKGQGERRTRMAEEFAKSMQASGYTSSVWYQMD